MSWIALVLTLLLEQAWPLPAANPVYAGVAGLSDQVARNFNAGKARHGLYGWVAIVVTGAIVTAAMYFFLRSWNWLAALIFDVVVLFFTLGFRQFSHPITLIQSALEAGDVDEARRVFLQWRRSIDPDFEAGDLGESEIARLSIEFGTLSSHRHVFGVLFWFLVLPGPSGAVLYRLSEYLCRHWNPLPPSRNEQAESDGFGRYAQDLFAIIDWVPTRLSAIGFAIVGDFEGAMHCWRQLNLDRRPSANQSRLLLLATAGGAIGVRVLSPLDSARFLDPTVQEAVGLVDPSPFALRSAVGLAWRAMILWIVLLLLLSIAAVT